MLGLEGLIGAGYDGGELAEHLHSLGYDPAQVLGAPAGDRAKVYAENKRVDAQKALRAFLAREALGYGLASAETAFVAIRREANAPVSETVIVANALPSGWSPGFLQTGGRMLRAMAFGGAPAPMMARAAMPAAPADGGTVGRFALARPAAPRAERGIAPTRTGRGPALFAGVPTFAGGEAILFDSACDGTAKIAAPLTIAAIAVRFADRTIDAARLDGELALTIFVDDLAAPRATVRLAEIMRQGGERPLNIAWRAGTILRVVLLDPRGVWAAGGPAIEVSLR